jgi:hypothetical protein
MADESATEAVVAAVTVVPTAVVAQQQQHISSSSTAVILAAAAAAVQWLRRLPEYVKVPANPLKPWKLDLCEAAGPCPFS